MKPDLGTSAARDAAAGLTVALVSIPEGMAYALVAGVNPIYGLYTGMVTTVVAALTGSTSRLIVTLTNALALVAGEQIGALSPEDPMRAMFTLTLLVGAMMTFLGLLKLGSAMRFVSREVMGSFIFATALLIVLGQLKDLVGYTSDLDGGKLVKAVDIVRHVALWNVETTIAGIGTIVILGALRRTRFASISDILIIAIATISVLALGLSDVETVGDISEVPRGLSALPGPMLPDFSLIPALLGGALAATVIGLSESSGVGAAYPNRDGSRSDLSRDFLGQGLGNLAGSFFQALPAGGSLSRTAINASGGAKTRASGVFAGVMMAVILVLFGPIAELIPLTGLAGLLIVIAVEVMIREGHHLAKAARTSRLNAAIALVVIVTGVADDLTAAIFVGVVLSLLAFAYRAATRVKVVELYQDESGAWSERPAPERIAPGQAIVLEFRGDLYFASIYAFDDLLPLAEGATGASVILRAKDRSFQSTTGTDWLSGYAKSLHRHGVQLCLSEVGEDALDSLEHTGVVDLIGRDHVYPEEERLFAGTEKALGDCAERGVQPVNRAPTASKV